MGLPDHYNRYLFSENASAPSEAFSDHGFGLPGVELVLIDTKHAWVRVMRRTDLFQGQLRSRLGLNR